MAVNVDTDLLRSNGSKALSNMTDCDGPHQGIKGMSDYGISAITTFKSNLSNSFATFNEHSNKYNDTLQQCAERLEEYDNATGAVAKQMVVQTEQVKTEQTITTSNEYVNPYDPDNLPDKTLYDCDGVLQFTQNGKRVYETFCQTCLKYSYDLKFLILKMGYDAGFWYREDGVQMWGEDVMYAAAIPRWGANGIEDESYNPSGSTWRRGDKWYGTSGPGRIVGICGTSEQALILNGTGERGDITYDTYTAWMYDREWISTHDEYDRQKFLEYQALYNAKDPNHATSNIINNPPADPSERYYQSNQTWVNLFAEVPLAREYIPDGVVDWNNSSDWKNFDWAAYFQKNNPDRIG